jgi:hypothetical protein
MNEKKIERVCVCEDWKENIPTILDAWISYYHRYGVEYEGKLFIYCPWCGEELENE